MNSFAYAVIMAVLLICLLLFMMPVMDENDPNRLGCYNLPLNDAVTIDNIMISTKDPCTAPPVDFTILLIMQSITLIIIIWVCATRYGRPTDRFLQFSVNYRQEGYHAFDQRFISTFQRWLMAIAIGCHFMRLPDINKNIEDTEYKSDDEESSMTICDGCHDRVEMDSVSLVYVSSVSMGSVEGTETCTDTTDISSNFESDTFINYNFSHHDTDELDTIVNSL